MGTTDLRDQMGHGGEQELQIYDDDDNELEMKQILEEHNRNLNMQALQG